MNKDRNKVFANLGTSPVCTETESNDIYDPS